MSVTSRGQQPQAHLAQTWMKLFSLLLSQEVWRLEDNRNLNKLIENKIKTEIFYLNWKLSIQMFIFLFCLSPALSSGSNKFYPTNNNVELENLYKHYKSTGQVRQRRKSNATTSDFVQLNNSSRAHRTLPIEISCLSADEHTECAFIEQYSSCREPDCRFQSRAKSRLANFHGTVAAACSEKQL